MAQTIAQFRKGLKSWQREIRKETLRPMRSYLRDVRKRARKQYKNTELGRALWRRRRKGGNSPPLVVDLGGRKARLTPRYSTSQKAWIGGTRVAGIAQRIETGQRIQSHRIRARSGPFLFFQVPGGGFAKKRSVQHPGAPVQRKKVILRETARGFNKFSRQMTNLLEGLYSREVAR